METGNSNGLLEDVTILALLLTNIGLHNQLQHKWLVSDRCSEQVEHCSLRDTPWSVGQSIR